MAKVTESMLWSWFITLMFHSKECEVCQGDVPILADPKTTLVYSIDFSDIYVYLPFPKKNRETFREDPTIPWHGSAVEDLWRGIFDLPKDDSSYLFTLAPGARLEIYEVLRHLNYSVETWQGIIGSTMTSRKPQEMRRVVKDCIAVGYFRAELAKLLTRPMIKQQIEQPIAELIRLLDNKVLRPYEEVISSSDYEAILENRATNKSEPVQRYFNKYSSGASEHDLFHDAVDVLNIMLVFDTEPILQRDGKFATLVSHAFHTLNAGEKLSFLFKDKRYNVVRHSITPLYLIQASSLEPADKGVAFFDRGHKLLSIVTEDLSSLPIIKELQALIKNKVLLKLRLKEQRVTEIPDSIYRMIEAFAKGFFEPLNPMYLERGKTPSAEESEDALVEEIVELEFDWQKMRMRKEEITEKLKQGAIDVRERTHPLDSPLTKLYVPTERFEEYIDRVMEWTGVPRRRLG